MTDWGRRRPHHPEPIAWATVERLAARAQEIAKGWLLALVERSPLDAAGAIPAAALAAEGPALCAAVARALGSDVELDRLRSGGDLAPLAQRAGALAGARDAAEAVAAVDALRAALWREALVAHGPRPDAAAVEALADRLATVAATVAGTAVVGALLPDAADAPAPTADASPAVPSEAPSVEVARPEAPPVDGPSGSVTPLRQRSGSDARNGLVAEMDDADLWIATLEQHIDRCQREGGGLALLRVELLDGARVVASAPDGDGTVPYGQLAQAIRRAIRRQDLIASDHLGRAWVIAPGVGRAGALALAERIGASVEEGEPWHGEPLAATIGFAIYGEDGADAEEMIERAEEAMLAATAAGMRIGEAPPQPHREREGDRPGPRSLR